MESKPLGHILDAHPRRSESVRILTTFDLDEYVYDALSAGASGFLLERRQGQTRCSTQSAVVAAGEALLAPNGHPPADRASSPVSSPCLAIQA